MQLDHVGLKVSSLEYEITQRGGKHDSEIRDVHSLTAHKLWGIECGALRVWFQRDQTGDLELFEQVDKEAAPVPETHVCFKVSSIHDALPWWESVGFRMVSESVLEIGSKHTVMLSSHDGVIVQLLSNNAHGEEGE